MKQKICSKCKEPKQIKAKNLCNSCYSFENCRVNKENENENQKFYELELQLKITKELLSKEYKKNISLSNELNFTKENFQNNLQKSINKIEVSKTNEIPTKNNF